MAIAQDNPSAQSSFNLMAHIYALRPKQWIKNFFVFAGLIFAKKFTDPALCLSVAWVFVIFCMASSGIYLINDMSDIEKDRRHPKKRHRPIASGLVSKRTATMMAVALLVGSLAICAVKFPMHPLVPLCMVIYIIKELLYTFKLKHVVMVDILINSIGFPLRALAGILAIQPVDPAADPIVISSWFVACIFFLSLFIAICKRRHELLLLQGDAANHRAVLEEYSPDLLDQLVAISTSATIISYALYCILKTPGAEEYYNPAHISHMVWTIPLVIFGVFRYLYMVYRRDEGGAPEQLILRDKWLLADVVVWLGAAVFVMMRG